MPNRELLTKYLLPVLALLLPLGLYVKTLSPSYIPIDSAEFTMCIKYWGVCHPPGFPLYVALGHLFVNIFPLGALIYKTNLFSAIFGTLTTFFLYLGMVELRIRRAVAFMVAVSFAVSMIFWEYSVSADVFSFATFLLALSFFLLFRGWYLPAVFVLGLSSSHFYITAVLAPIYYWYKYGLPGLKNFKNTLVSSLVFLSAFFPQVLMYWRMTVDPPVNWGHAQGLGGFYYFLRRQEFGSIFLIANPVLTFHISKLFNHFKEYFPILLFNFGVILPIVVVIATGVKGFLKREAILILACFFTVLSIQLFLLSTIDPTGADNPFQIGKFYLTTFVILAPLMGLAVDTMAKKFFGEDLNYVILLLGILILINLLSNFRVNDLSGNRFTENMILDGFSLLPPNSIAITVSHIVYFGGRYEQEENRRFPGVTILYFPNEKNKDNEFYHPEIFAGSSDSAFVTKIKEGKNLGKAEEYVLDVISKNTQRPIYIFQGSFEEGFFAYLKPYLEPHGLWWKVEMDTNKKVDVAGKLRILSDMRNRDVQYNDFELKAIKQDVVNYAISYHSSGIFFAQYGAYDEAIEAMEGSLRIKDAVNIRDSLDLIKRTRDLDFGFGTLLDGRNKAQLLELGNNLFTLKNYQRCTEVFGGLVTFDTGSAQVFNNLASCQAYLGRDEEARINYRRALEIDPNLAIAKQGLERLGGEGKKVED